MLQFLPDLKGGIAIDSFNGAEETIWMHKLKKKMFRLF